MGRAPRITEGGFAYYVVCRSLDNRNIFTSDDCFDKFVDVVQESLGRWEPRLLAYSVVPNQFHMLVVPRKDGDLSKWVGWITSVHAMRNKHLSTSQANNGLYERRFRSFPVQENQRLVEAIAWIESLPQRVLADSRSSFEFHAGTAENHWLSLPPVALPADWRAYVAQGIGEERERQISYSIERGAPYGEPDWVERIAKRFQLEMTLRPRGRPRKPESSK